MAKQTSAGPFLVTEAPSLIKCSHCHSPLMAATVNGLVRHIDTVALTQLGELAALLAGTPTFNLYRDRLWRRDQFTIAKGKSTYPVFAEHRCGQPPLPEHQDHSWVEAATAIVIQACGGVVVSDDLPSNPPF